MLFLLEYSKILLSSELLPLKDAIIKTSPFLIAPRDPCPASVGSKVKLAIPIEDRVLDIFSKIFADFPTPQQTTPTFGVINCIYA